mmetsp:Transcript_39512/g.104284  ORF Transcript_39512/g.104284 Transcript_39512/m.104284 type:complete len:189 (-) Transcript_39512:464-1030(-)
MRTRLRARCVRRTAIFGPARRLACSLLRALRPCGRHSCPQYGVEIMSINVISATPCDKGLTSSLASGAVASAEALQAETAARGQANAVRIAAEAEAARVKIEAQGHGEAEVIKATAHADGIRSVAAALSDKGGHAAMGQHIAEMYVSQMAQMAENSKMMIVPQNPTDVNGVMASAFALSGQVQRLAGA